jgi:hypothetical protein
MEGRMIAIVAMLSCAIALAEDNESKPLVYKDNDTNLILVVESNRQKVTCLKPEGELLWHKDLAEYIRDKERESPAVQRMREVLGMHKKDVKEVPILIHAIYKLQPPIPPRLKNGYVGLTYRTSFRLNGGAALKVETGELHLIAAD